MKKEKIIMPWETAMYKAIEEIVDKKVSIELPHYLPNEPITPAHESLTKWLKKKRTQEEERNFRLAHILDILKQCGVDMEEFKKSFMYNNERTGLLLSHVQGIIDGYEYREGKNRRPLGQPADLSKTHISYTNGELTVVIAGKIYSYTMDEHCLIYLNGNLILNPKPVLTRKEFVQEWNESMKGFMESMHADRMAHDIAMERSMIAASKFRVEE